MFFCTVLTCGLVYKIYNWNKTENMKYKIMVQKNMDEILNEYNMTQMKNT
jgi:hypothetical protein